MAWVIGFGNVVSNSATLYALTTEDDVNGSPPEVRIHGTGFTYDAQGLLDGGTITHMELVDVSAGPAGVVLQTVTMTGGLSASDLYTEFFAPAATLKAEISTWSFDFHSGEPVPTANGLRITAPDGSYADIEGTNLNDDAVGIVTAVRWYNSGDVLQDEVTTGLPASLDALSVAVGGYSRGFYIALTAGDDTVVGSAANLFGLDGGAGNDSITQTGVMPGLAEYGSATGPVTIDLSAGTASGGGAGSDTFTNITSAFGSQFGDTIIGSSDNNTLFGQRGDDTLTGNGGSDYFAVYLDNNEAFGADTVKDFVVGTDKIQVGGDKAITFADVTISSNGNNDAVVTFTGYSGSITLEGVSAANLGQDDFFFTGGNNGGGGGNNATQFDDWSRVLDITVQPQITDNRIVIANTDGTETIINGSGFQDPPNSTITSIERHIPNTSVLVCVTGGLPSLTSILDAFADVAAVDAAITWTVQGGAPEFSNDGTWVLIANGDQAGTYTKLNGTGLPTSQGGMSGTISSVEQLQDDKSTVIETVPFSPGIGISLFAAAVFGEGEYITDVLFAGENTISSSAAAGIHINVSGGAGDDTFVGGAADENFEIGIGSDTVDGGGGFNVITNWQGAGPMTADLDAKTASGAGWSATYTNVQGVSGSRFGDTLLGDADSNHIQGEGGDDTLTGRGSGDTFFYFGGDGESADFGNDTITDFGVGPDQIMILGFAGIDDFADLTITDNGNGDAVITFLGGNGSITLDGVSKSTLTGDDFAFSNNGGGGNGAALSIVADQAEKDEGSGGNREFTFFVNRSGDTSGEVSVEWSISLQEGTADAADFTGATSGTVFFGANETQKQIIVNVSSDFDFEGDETFAVVLSNPTGGAFIASGMAQGAILDDDNGGGPVGFFDWREVFNGGSMNSPPPQVTTTKIEFQNTDGSRTVLNGAFTLDVGGDPTGGNVSSIHLVDQDGTTVRTTVTAAAGSTLPSIAQIKSRMRPVDDLTDRITWYGVIDQDLEEPDSFTTTKLVLSNTDGTKTVVIGSGFSAVGDSPVFTGTVTSIRQTAADGTTVLAQVTPPPPSGTTLTQALAAISEYQANQYFFAYLFSGNNVITGNFPEDGGGMLFGGAGSDTITGGTGYDVVEYDTAASAVVVNLKAGTATGGGGTDTLKGSIEGVSGSAFADTITGSDADNEIKGRYGNDKISGLGGADWLHGDEGDDTLEGGAGTDVLMGGDDTDTASYAGSAAGVTVDLDLQGTDPQLEDASAQTSGGDASGDKLYGIENLTGSAHADTLTGDDGANRIDGGLGNDIVEGGDGDDVLIGGGGTATTPGNDMVSYAGAAAGVTVSLALATKQNTGGAGSDTLSGFESIIGSAHADLLIGSAGANTLNGGEGDDVLIGGAGKDTLIGGGGKDAASYETATAGVTASLADSSKNTGDALGDTYDGIGRLIGSKFNDVLTGDYGSNRLIGLAGNETLVGKGGGDYFDGGAGVDTVSYSGSSTGVEVSLLDDAFGEGVNGKGGDAEGNHFVWDAGAGRSTIENIIGSSGDDIITGDGGNNRLEGGSGDDVIEGGAGDDVLIGGADSAPGAKVFLPGRDTVSYEHATKGVVVDLRLTTVQETKGAGKDTITGFENITGSDFDDVLTGSTLANKISGGDGDDTIQGLGAESDDLDGGDGIDTVSYANSALGVVVTLSEVSQSNSPTSDASNDQLRNFENILGSAKNDSLFGNDLDNTIEGGLGDDVLSGDGALVGGSDTVSYARAAAAVTVNLANTTQQSTGGAGKDTLSNFENLTGSAFDDKLTGDAGGNTIIGGKGADIIEGGAGADRLDGGENVVGKGDTVSYAGASSGVFVDLLVQDGKTGQPAWGSDSDGDILTGFENVTGSDYDDLLFGDAGNNRLDGRAGDDWLEGDAGDDIIVGGANGHNGDTASYGSAKSAVIVNLALTMAQDTKGAGKDTLSGIENIAGSAFNDVLTGDKNGNEIFGGDGDDVIIGGAGGDYLDGGQNGTGGDTVSYASSAVGVKIDLRQEVQLGSGTDAYLDRLIDIENIVGSAKNDILIGDYGDNVIDGGAGNDTLTGNGGIDTLSYAKATAAVTANLATKSVTGGAGIDTLTDAFENLIGSAFDDKLTGDGAANTITGGKGNDVIVGGAGADRLDGGESTTIGDTVSYASSAAGITVDLGVQDGATAQLSDGDAAGDILSGFENITGSTLADTLTGSDGANRIDGGQGNDWIEGRLGNDVLIGGLNEAGHAVGDVVSYFNSVEGVAVSLALTTAQSTGLDKSSIGAGIDTLSGFESLQGSAHGDRLTGDKYANTIWGEAGDDIIQGGGGTDSLYGGDNGAGGDTVSYAASALGVIVDLSQVTQAATNGKAANGDAANDQLYEFENTLGSAFADKLTGDGGANKLSGGAGNDTLIGGAGDDLLIGGAGFDILTGGLGADTFEYAKLSDGGGTGASVERITDFVSGEDVLRLWVSGFKGTTAGVDVNFASGATPLAGGKGAWFLYDTDDGKLYFDADGTGSGAKTLLLTLDGHPDLLATDIKIV